MGSPKRVRSRLKEQMTPKGETRGWRRTQARDSEDLDRLSIISGELVPRHSDFDKLHSALTDTILFIFPHRDLQA